MQGRPHNWRWRKMQWTGQMGIMNKMLEEKYDSYEAKGILCYKREKIYEAAVNNKRKKSR